MTTWIIPCNVKYYDVFGAFNTLKRIEWRQSTKVEVGDQVYVYVGRPYSAIMFKCKVNRVNITDLSIDDSAFNKELSTLPPYGRYMELELTDTFPKDQFELGTLREKGFKGSFQGPFRATSELLQLLEE